MTSIDTLIHTHTGLTRTELLRELVDLSDTGGLVADQLNSGAYQLENLQILLRQAIRQAMTDLSYARCALDEGRPVNDLGILQRNGQNVDLYAARVGDATTRLTAILALTVRILDLGPPTSKP